MFHEMFVFNTATMPWLGSVWKLTDESYVYG